MKAQHKLLLVFGVLWVQNHPNRQARGSMQITHHKEHGLRLPALMRSKPVLFSALTIGLLPVQLFAQNYKWLTGQDQ